MIMSMLAIPRVAIPVHRFTVALDSDLKWHVTILKIVLSYCELTALVYKLERDVAHYRTGRDIASENARLDEFHRNSLLVENTREFVFLNDVLNHMFEGRTNTE